MTTYTPLLGRAVGRLLAVAAVGLILVGCGGGGNGRSACDAARKVIADKQASSAEFHRALDIAVRACGPTTS